MSGSGIPTYWVVLFATEDALVIDLSEIEKTQKFSLTVSYSMILGDVE